MTRKRRCALTLLELIVVIAILAALAALVVPMVSTTSDDANTKVTTAQLVELRNVIMTTYRNDMSGLMPRPAVSGGTVTGARQDNPQLRYLFVNPGQTITASSVTINPSTLTIGTTTTTITPETSAVSYDPVRQLGWRGPYIATVGFTYPTPATGTGPADPNTFSHLFDEAGDPTVLDGWRNPIVIRLTSTDAAGNHYEIRSAGPDGVLSTLGVTPPSSPDDIFLQLN